MLFSRNKLFSIFKNKLFPENSLFFENRIKKMVTTLPSLLRKLKSIMFLPAAQDKFHNKNFFLRKLFSFKNYDKTLVYKTMLSSAIANFKNFIYFLDNQITRHIDYSVMHVSCNNS